MSKQITNIFMGDRRAEVGLAATFLLAIVAAVGGLAIGPGQVIWCLFLSGSEAASYEIQPNREVVVPLAPDQNPLRFMARVEYLKPNRHIGTMVTAFDSVLRRGDEQLWASQFQISHKDEDKDKGLGLRVGSSYTTCAVHLFSVDEAGDFTFVAKPTNYDQLEVKSITLKVRQNVTEVHVVSAVVGFALLVLAVVLTVIGFRFRRRDARTDA